MAVNGIIGIKLGMTQVFVDDGTLVGCTVLQAGPCVVVQRRTKQTDGYEAAQLGLVEFVKPQRVNKAKGFQGGVKRWHYAGGDSTHGSMHHRAPGGIGGSSFPSRVWKNQHFPGHMGNQKVTAKNLKVVKVDTDENLLLVRGSVPGPSGTYIFIRKAKQAK